MYNNELKIKKQIVEQNFKIPNKMKKKNSVLTLLTINYKYKPEKNNFLSLKTKQEQKKSTNCNSN